eukprot:CAMPEP_0184027554 /NCGR_PEP_ID=MMETSP0954-20121128/14265_1 /TAXON_ID=627963 /ORGANISM="Aplanochytrium sp, Strain PBS07" /LENGTH=394 /DNA_ID=CAMNT_0026312131 /DNA_START=570 /DNA_END=1754 /DNA_ORIENTATION=-
MTKHGKRKSTMLIGVDPRDWRLGLSWTHVKQEGPRKWHPASDCSIHVAPAGSNPRCEKDPDDTIKLFVPHGKPIIIPIRVEVLSAVKGAGDFSRYSVQCDAKIVPKKSSVKESPAVLSSWTSPPILVEAKWLPAAPVREQNKRRFNRSGNVSNEIVKVLEKKSSNLLRPNSNGSYDQPLTVIDASVSIIRNAAISLNALNNPNNPSKEAHAGVMKDVPQLDMLVRNLRIALGEYEAARMGPAVMNHQYNSFHPGGSNGKVGVMYMGMPPGGVNSQINPKPPKQATQNLYKKVKVSSPPREKHTPHHLAPRPPLLNLNGNPAEMAANGFFSVNYPNPVSMESLKHHPNASNLPVSVKSSGGAGAPGLNSFDLLAAAASSKHSINDRQQLSKQQKV